MDELIVVDSQENLELAYSVMHELRTQLSYENFQKLYSEAKERDQYDIIAIKRDSRIIAVMGYRILYDFVHGKHVYIDDLVTSKEFRSQGLGAKLLEYAEKIAHLQNCTGLRLCTGVENESGKKFYERAGWSLRSVAYKKKI